MRAAPLTVREVVEFAPATASASTSIRLSRPLAPLSSGDLMINAANRSEAPPLNSSRPLPATSVSRLGSPLNRNGGPWSPRQLEADIPPRHFGRCYVTQPALWGRHKNVGEV